MNIRKTRCRGCPWAQGSARGYLGGSTPLEFLGQYHAEVRVPCHEEVDWESDDLDAEVAGAPTCRGYLSFMANSGKLPRDPALWAEVEAAGRDRLVMGTTPEFLAHHTLGEGG